MKVWSFIVTISTDLGLEQNHVPVSVHNATCISDARAFALHTAIDQTVPHHLRRDINDAGVELEDVTEE